MNRLSTADRTRAIACLVEGNSQRATCRMTGLAKKTVARLAVEIGQACERFSDNIMRDLPCTQIQCDEIWSFCYAKAKNVPLHLRGSGAGEIKVAHYRRLESVMSRIAYTRPPIERMQRIARMLRTGQRFTARTVAQTFEVNHKTAVRDIEFLRDRLGYDFEYDKSSATYRLNSAPEPAL
jgi:hypothetical protein